MTTTTPASAPDPNLVPLPVTSVTLLEDRAEIERETEVDLVTGTQRLLLGPITPLAVDRSQHAEILGAAGTVVDLRIVRRYVPPSPGAPGDDASALEHRVHELTEHIRRAEHDIRRVTSRLAVLDQLLAELHRDIAESTGAGEAQPQRWSEELASGEAAYEDAAEELLVVRDRLDDLRDQLNQAKAARQEAEHQPLRLTAHIEVVIEAERAGPARLRVRHLTPCALWRPVYRATLAADNDELQLEGHALIWQHTGEDWSQVRIILSTARPTLAANPPQLLEDVLVLRDRPAEERRTVEVDLREVDIQSVGADDVLPEPAEGSPPPVLPGVDDGGESRLLAVPSQVTVLSDGRPHRIQLFSSGLPCRAEYSCAPEISDLVTYSARFRNSTGSVLLSGPVDLIRGTGFIGRGELRFTAPGAETELSFGSEDTFRATRTIEESRSTAALTGRTVLTRTVHVSLSRFAPTGSAPVTVAVRERIPVSEVSAVEVRLDKERSVPTPDAADADGVLRYDVTLGPDERRTLVVGYEISAARSVTVGPGGN
ncbi:mucoidy inhibitor MuiA family protein [Streptomyces griseorubiginosus]|uniref:mucoidy inhibitor MuiA family protein n=1 Tax=Streptomyces griseorubiginosus TaxID=67304 RepID=UPI0036E89DC3